MKKAALAILLSMIVAAPAAAETIEKQFSVASGGELVIDVETGGSFEITGWGRSEVQVTAELEDFDPSEVDLTIDSTGDSVIISSDIRRKSRRMSFRYRFTVHVPDRFDVSIDSSGGSLSIEGVEGRFEGQTMGGDLSLHDVRGRLDLKTMGGDVEMTGARVDGRVSTMGGDLHLDDVEGDLQAKTMGGDVKLRDVSGDVAVETMGGDVLHAQGQRGSRGGAEGPVKLRTMGGEIRVDDAPEGADVETMGGDVTVGTAVQFVRASTQGGNVRIREVDGTVKASTMGGDVEARVVDRGGASRHDVDLSSQSGNITLIVPSDFSMDVDVEITWTYHHRERPEIISDFPLKIEEADVRDRDRDRERGRLITGTGHVRGGDNRVVIRTVDGDVRIQRD